MHKASNVDLFSFVQANKGYCFIVYHWSVEWWATSCGNSLVKQHRIEPNSATTTQTQFITSIDANVMTNSKNVRNEMRLKSRFLVYTDWPWLTIKMPTFGWQTIPKRTKLRSKRRFERSKTSRSIIKVGCFHSLNFIFNLNAWSLKEPHHLPWTQSFLAVTK